jgi:hypothetical protein
MNVVTFITRRRSVWWCFIPSTFEVRRPLVDMIGVVITVITTTFWMSGVTITR